jgi:hypothetical protein
MKRPFRMAFLCLGNCFLFLPKHFHEWAGCTAGPSAALSKNISKNGPPNRSVVERSLCGDSFLEMFRQVFH